MIPPTVDTVVASTKVLADYVEPSMEKLLLL